ncbi:uncharacterized protein TNCV_479511 [Trichonephila clavipes]|nr:uncharacterized protein TNCV_479511 [Trichonephila clavipes]
MYSACVAWGTLNSHRAASPLMWLVEEEERWEAFDHPQSVLPLHWSGIELNHTVTCMVLKATAIDRRYLALCHDEFRGPCSDLCQSGGTSNNNITTKTSTYRIQTIQAAVATPTMCLNEEIVQPISHTQNAFECCYLVKSWCDASCKKQKCVPARF